jgi:hypothetical protein
VEGEPLWLAAQGHHLVHSAIRGLLAAMSVRDLLTFNLFLQLTDGLVSYQAFALGAAEANPVVAAAIVNWVWFGDWSTTKPWRAYCCS